eukprot:TRINITY_DN3688_c1_g3_i1.p1 TRINITY_DN3688_c1_g3~~TRINITY_DN3688_c1_g3_i1.p1  ORF type:complete len:3431 (+),score=615.72 TRINITY_DN3688_c1_g3_i1:306-10295(+)
MVQSGKKAANYIESVYKGALADMDLLVMDDSIYEANLDFTQRSVGTCPTPSSKPNAKCDVPSSTIENMEKDLSRVLDSTRGVKLQHMISLLQTRFAVAPTVNKLTALAAGENLIDMSLSGSSAEEVFNNNRKLHHLLLEQLRKTPDVIWSYFGDSTTSIFSGYRMVHSRVVFTYGNENGMTYWYVDNNGKPTKKFHVDTTWVLQSTDWFQIKAQSGWTGIYRFSTSASSELSDGVSAVHRFPSGVLGTDFLLTDFIHSFLDTMRIPSDAIFFIMNTEKQLVASNKLQAEFLDGSLAGIDSVSNPFIREVAEHLLALFPAIGNPKQYPMQWGEFLSAPEFVDFTYISDSSRWDVELMSMQNPLQGDAALQWTVVYARPYLSRQRIMKNSRNCVTKDSFQSAISGAVLSWRVQHIDFIHDALLSYLGRSHICLQNLALHANLRETDSPGSPSYLAQLAETCGITYIHVANTKVNSRTLTGIELISTEPFVVSCVEEADAPSDCVDYQLQHYEPDQTNGASTGVPTPVNWGWYNKIDHNSPLNVVSDIATPYEMMFAPGRSAALRHKGNYIYNAGISSEELQDALLQGSIPKDTAIYITDLLGTIVASTTSGESDYITAAEQHFQETGLKENILDHGVRRTETTKEQETLYIDYKRVKWNTRTSDYWVLVVVRRALQTVTAVNVIAGSGRCVPCQDNQILITRRERFIKDATESLNNLLDIAVRSTLLVQQYLLKGLTTPASISVLLQHQLTRHQGKLFWIGYFDPSQSKFIAYKYVNKKAVPLENHKIRTERPHWWSKAVFLDTMWAQTSTDQWVWSGRENWEGKQVHSAVRLLGGETKSKTVIVAGIDEEVISNTFHKEANAASINGFPKASFHLFGNDDLSMSEVSKGMSIKPSDVKKDIQNVAPEYFQSAVPWDVHQQDVREIITETGIHTVAAYSHASPATSREFKTNKWIHWLISLSVERDTTECADSQTCTDRINEMSSSYYRVIFDHIRRYIEIAEQEVNEAPDFTVVSNPYQAALQNGDTGRLIRTYLQTQIMLFPTIGSIVFHMSDLSFTQFISIIRVGGYLTQDITDPSNFVFYICDGDKKCSFTTLDDQPYEYSDMTFVDRIQTWNSYEDYLTNEYVATKTARGLSAAVSITAAGYSHASDYLSVKLREMDVSRDTFIFICSDHTWQHLLALNKETTNEIFVAAREKLRTEYAGQENGIARFQHGPNTYTVDFTTLDGKSVAVVSGVGVSTFSYGITIETSSVCVEQGSCEEDVDSLREKDIRSKADFISLRTTRLLHQTKLTTQVLVDAVEADISQFIAKARSSLFSKPFLTRALLQDKAAGNIIIVQREQVWLRNTTGTYLQLNSGSTISSNASLEFVEEHSNSFGASGKSSIKFQRMTPSNVLIELAVDTQAIQKAILHPFSGVVMIAYGKGFNTSNSDCPAAVEELHHKSVLRSALVDSEVTMINNCVVDLREVWSSGTMFVVGSVESGTHQESYPAEAKDYGCVTWESCRMSRDLSMLQLMNSVVQYSYFESEFAEIELRRISQFTGRDDDLIKEMLTTSHYVKWILSGVSVASYSGWSFVDDRSEIVAVQCDSNNRCSIDQQSVFLFNLTSVPSHDAFSFNDHHLYYRFNDMVACVELSALEDPASDVVSGDGVSFSVSLRPATSAHSQVKPGELQRSNKGLDYEVYTKTDSGVLIVTEYTSVKKRDTQESCTMKCESDLIKFQGVDVIAETVAFHINELVDMFLNRLDIVVLQIVNGLLQTPDMEKKSGFEICTFLFTDVGTDSKEGTIGWFSGDTFVQCRVDRTVSPTGRYHLVVGSMSSKTSWEITKDPATENTNFEELTSADPTFIPSWVGDGQTPEELDVETKSLFAIKRMAVGWVAMSITNAYDNTSKNKFFTTFAQKKIAVARNSNEEEVLGDSGVVSDPGSAVAEVRIPSSSNWRVFVGYYAPSAAPPPRLGCFTAVDCACQTAYAGQAHHTTFLQSDSFVNDLRVYKLMASRPIPGFQIDYFSITSAQWVIRKTADRYTGYIHTLNADVVFVDCTETVCITRTVNKASGEIGIETAIAGKLPLFGIQLDKVLFGLDMNLFGQPNHVMQFGDTFVGVDFITDMKGISEISKAFPTGVETFLVDKTNRKLLANPASFASKEDPNAGLISERCARNYLTNDRTQCGTSSEAYSLYVFKSDRFHYVTAMPKVAAAVTESFYQSFFPKKLFTRLHKILTDNNSHKLTNAVYFVHSDGSVLGCDKDSRKFYLGNPTSTQIEYYIDERRKEVDHKNAKVNIMLLNGRERTWQSTESYPLVFGNKARKWGITLFKAVFSSDNRYLGTVAVDFVTGSLGDVLKTLSEEDLQHPSMGIFTPSSGIAGYPSDLNLEKLTTFASDQRIQYYSSIDGEYFKSSQPRKVLSLPLSIGSTKWALVLTVDVLNEGMTANSDCMEQSKCSSLLKQTAETATFSVFTTISKSLEIKKLQIIDSADSYHQTTGSTESHTLDYLATRMVNFEFDMIRAVTSDTQTGWYRTDIGLNELQCFQKNCVVLRTATLPKQDSELPFVEGWSVSPSWEPIRPVLSYTPHSKTISVGISLDQIMTVFESVAVPADWAIFIIQMPNLSETMLQLGDADLIAKMMKTIGNVLKSRGPTPMSTIKPNHDEVNGVFAYYSEIFPDVFLGVGSPMPEPIPKPSPDYSSALPSIRYQFERHSAIDSLTYFIGQDSLVGLFHDSGLVISDKVYIDNYIFKAEDGWTPATDRCDVGWTTRKLVSAAPASENFGLVLGVPSEDGIFCVGVANTTMSNLLSSITSGNIIIVVTNTNKIIASNTDSAASLELQQQADSSGPGMHKLADKYLLRSDTSSGVYVAYSKPIVSIVGDVQNQLAVAESLSALKSLHLSKFDTLILFADILRHKFTSVMSVEKSTEFRRKLYKRFLIYKQTVPWIGISLKGNQPSFSGYFSSEEEGVFYWGCMNIISGCPSPSKYEIKADSGDPIESEKSDFSNGVVPDADDQTVKINGKRYLITSGPLLDGYSIVAGMSLSQDTSTRIVQNGTLLLGGDLPQELTIEVLQGYFDTQVPNGQSYADIDTYKVTYTNDGSGYTAFQVAVKQRVAQITFFLDLKVGEFYSDELNSDRFVTAIQEAVKQTDFPDALWKVSLSATAIGSGNNTNVTLLVETEEGWFGNFTSVVNEVKFVSNDAVIRDKWKIISSDMEETDPPTPSPKEGTVITPQPPVPPVDTPIPLSTKAPRTVNISITEDESDSGVAFGLGIILALVIIGGVVYFIYKRKKKSSFYPSADDDGGVQEMDSHVVQPGVPRDCEDNTAHSNLVGITYATQRRNAGRRQQVVV